MLQQLLYKAHLVHPLAFRNNPLCMGYCVAVARNNPLCMGYCVAVARNNPTGVPVHPRNNPRPYRAPDLNPLGFDTPEFNPSATS